MTYNRTLPPITLDDALATPGAEELFIESSASGQPKITIQTTLEIDGHTLNVTFNDTSIADVLAILRRQARPAPEPAQPRPRRPCRTRHTPRYETMWSDFDFDDVPDADPRAAAVVATAAQLLELGKAAGWSNALELARQTLNTQEILQ